MALSDAERRSLIRSVQSAPGGRIRVRCGQCGAHVFAPGGFSLAGQCENCGSYQLRRLEEEER